MNDIFSIHSRVKGKGVGRVFGCKRPGCVQTEAGQSVRVSLNSFEEGQQCF